MQVDLLLGVLEGVDQLLVLTLGIVVLLARPLVALPQQLVLHEQSLDAAHHVGRVGPQETQRFAQAVQLIDVVARATLRIGLFARSR